jgi:large subunit ribosomal protein L29
VSKSKEQLERIRDLPDGELAQALTRGEDELFRLRLGHYTQQVENPLSLRDKRREVARIKTVLTARLAGKETQAQGTAAASDAR